MAQSGGGGEKAMEMSTSSSTLSEEAIVDINTMPQHGEKWADFLPPSFPFRWQIGHTKLFANFYSFAMELLSVLSCPN